jgi:ribosomal protein L20A (L18A)
MKYTNEAFKNDLMHYLQAKQAKQEARSKRCWFFRTVNSDPASKAKVKFAEKTIEAIEAIEEENNSDNRYAFRQLIRKGLNGEEGFSFAVTEVATSNLYRLLIIKSDAIKEGRKAPHTASSSIVQRPGAH